MTTPTPPTPLYPSLATHARSLLLSALLATHGSRRAAARLLGIPERTLHSLLAHGFPTGTAAGRIPLFAPGDLEALAREHGWPDACAAARAARRPTVDTAVTPIDA